MEDSLLRLNYFWTLTFFYIFKNIIKYKLIIQCLSYVDKVFLCIYDLKRKSVPLNMNMYH